MQELNGQRSVLQLVCRPHIKAYIDATCREGCNIRYENEYVADELSVASPRYRVKNASDCNDQVHLGGILSLEHSFDALQNEYVLAHAHGCGDEAVRPGICPAAADAEGESQPENQAQEVDVDPADLELDVEVERDKRRGDNCAKRVDNDQVDVFDFEGIGKPNVVCHHHCQ